VKRERRDGLDHLPFFTNEPIAIGAGIQVITHALRERPLEEEIEFICGAVLQCLTCHNAASYAGYVALVSGIARKHRPSGQEQRPDSQSLAQMSQGAT
jgi:hypothetical protein